LRRQEHSADPLWNAVASFGVEEVFLPGGQDTPVAAPAAPSPRTAAARVPSAAEDASQAGLMASLRHEVGDCRGCRLSERRNQLVFGEGNPSSGVLFVGEAPGQTEDETGRPFVGRAGQLLDRILAAIQLDRTRAYIANVLKCRPPENRVPAPEEVAACGWILRRQIAIIRPRVIVALGASAASALLGLKSSIAQLRAGTHSFEGIPLLVTYHPSALLRTPALKRPVWEDMKRLRGMLDGMDGDGRGGDA
jgi:uracil-DNA glycosylase